MLKMDIIMVNVERRGLFMFYLINLSKHFHVLRFIKVFEEVHGFH